MSVQSEAEKLLQQCVVHTNDGKFEPQHAVGHVYVWLAGLGLEQNREKFSLPAAGHRGYSIDVGTSYGEVRVRLVDRDPKNVFAKSWTLTKWDHLCQFMDEVAVMVALKERRLADA